MIYKLIHAAKIVAITIQLAVPASLAWTEHLADSSHEYLTSPATSNTLPPTYEL